MAALAGALALGAIVRLFDPGRSAGKRIALAIVFAVALLILATSRPFEGLAFAVPLLVCFGIQLREGKALSLRSPMWPVMIIGLCGVAFMGYYNSRTTGNPLLMPYALNERTYSPLPLFIGQSRKEAPRYRNRAIKDFWLEVEKRNYQNMETVTGVVTAEINRILGNWWFYVGPALSFPVLLGFFSGVTQKRFRIAVFSMVATCVAASFSIYSQPHYFAAATVTIYLFAAEGLRYLCKLSRR